MSLIQEKLEFLHAEINRMGDMLDLDWCGNLLYTYNKHFNDIDPRSRAGSLLAFSGLLMEWENESGFPFCTSIQERNCHNFAEYLQEFLTYSTKIKKQCPNTYRVIVTSLRQLDERENFENIFSHIPSSLFNAARKTVFQDGAKNLEDDIYENAIKEAYENKDFK